MDFLGLTNAFLVETGIADTVSTLADPTDDVAQAMHWINYAWVEFQAERRWPFRWTEGSFTVTNGKTSYAPADLATPDLTNGIIIDPASIYAAEGNIVVESYVSLRDRRRAAASVDTTKVLNVAIKDHNTIETYPDIATTQTLYFDYWAAAQGLSENDDIPGNGKFIDDFHMLIVHNALFRYGSDIGGQEGANTYASHGALYAKLKNEYANLVL